MNSAKVLISIFLLLATVVDASPRKYEFNQILENILFQRTPGSFGIARVQSFISNFFKGPFKYYVSIQSGWVGSAKCLCYMLNLCTLLMKFAYKVGGWVQK